MVELDYLRREDAGKVFGGPGIQPYQGSGPFKSEHSAVKIYHVRGTDLPKCLFGASKNLTFGMGLDKKKEPYRGKGAVIFWKGGDGRVINAEDARHTIKVGLMPGATSPEDPGKEGGNFWD
jgi:hypothetical protein